MAPAQQELRPPNSRQLLHFDFRPKRVLPISARAHIVQHRFCIGSYLKTRLAKSAANNANGFVKTHHVGRQPHGSSLCACLQTNGVVFENPPVRFRFRGLSLLVIPFVWHGHCGLGIGVQFSPKKVIIPGTHGSAVELFCEEVSFLKAHPFENILDLVVKVLVPSALIKHNHHIVIGAFQILKPGCSIAPLIMDVFKIEEYNQIYRQTPLTRIIHER